jgi:hypothetical protein
MAKANDGSVSIVKALLSWPDKAEKNQHRQYRDQEISDHRPQPRSQSEVVISALQECSWLSSFCAAYVIE